MQEDREYISLFCSFTKKILRFGIGAVKPLNESTCKYKILPSAGDVDKFSEQDVDKFIAEVNLKHCDQLLIGCAAYRSEKILELMLITMKRGEISSFKLQGNPLPLPLPPVAMKEKAENSVELYEEQCFDVCLVLLDFTEEIPIWRLNPDEKYGLAFCHKTKGTELFKQEEFEAAFFRYSTAIRYIILISNGEQLDTELKEKCKQLKYILYFNLAACQLKFDEFENAIENCTRGLAIDTWNVKGLYRRALASKALGKIDEARSDLIKIIKRQPQNKAAGDLLESLMTAGKDNKPKDTDL